MSMTYFVTSLTMPDFQSKDIHHINDVSTSSGISLL